MKLNHLLPLNVAAAIAAIVGLGVVSTWAQDEPAAKDPPLYAPADNLPNELEPGDYSPDQLLLAPGGESLPAVSADGAYHRFLGEAVQDPSQEVAGLLKQLQSTESDEQRSALRTKLSELLGRQFDARQKRHEQQIAELEAQVKKLRELVRKRQANRSEIVSLRLEQLLRETQGLGW
jgi:hypothetical protein